MSFLKNPFSKDEPFTPTPKRQIHGIESIVVQVVEILFPNNEYQSEIFEKLLNHSSHADTVTILAILYNSRDYGTSQGLESAKKYVIDTISTPVTGSAHFYVFRECEFNNMKGAVKWVKSITKSKA